MQKEAYKPIIGSTPAIIENPIASGISAKAITIPANISVLILENHSFLFFQSSIFHLNLHKIYDCSLKNSLSSPFPKRRSFLGILYDI